MGDGTTLDQLKSQYRIRFYRDRSQDLPEFQPGSNVLSAIKDYFHDSSGEESPGFSRTSFFADSETNINIPESMRKKQGSSKNPRVSKLNGLFSTGEKNQTKMKATTSSAVNEKLKTPHFNNFDDNVSEEEVDDCESNMPLNLVVEREKETEIVRSVRSVSRDRIYSFDSSAVQGPPSPDSKSSPQKRLCFSDAVVKDKESLASVFASSYKRGPAEDVQTMQMHESVSYAGNKSDPRPNTTSAAYVAKVGDDEFIIEDDDGTDGSFFFANRKSSLGGSKGARSASSSTHGNQKLQAETSEVISGQSPISQSKRSSQTRRRGSNVNKKNITDESKTISGSEGPEETKPTPSSSKIQTRSAKCASQTFSAKLKTMLEQSLPGSKTIQQTMQTNKELEMVEDENWDEILVTNREKIKIPRNPKSNVERSKSSSVSHQMEVEIEPPKTVFEQSTVQFQAVGHTLKAEKTNKTKESLCKDENSFASQLVRFANIKPTITRMNVADLPVADEDEFVICDHRDFENNPKSCKKKSVKNPNHSKKNNKRGKNVACEVFNAPYTSARKSDNATDSRKSHNDERDSSSPLTVSHQMKVDIEPTKTVSEQSIVQPQTVGNTLKDDKTNKRKDSLFNKNSLASHLARIAHFQPPLTRMDVADLPVVDEDEFVIHDNAVFENDPKSCKMKNVKNPNDSKKNNKRGKNVACEVFNATYISARTSDDNATDSRKSHNDERDSSSPSDKKKSRPTELDKLVLQKYLQADVDNQSKIISSRPKRASAPPTAWWKVKPAARNSTFDVEEDSPQSSPKIKRKASADSEPSESQKNKEESFELQESGPLDQNEQETLKESDEKSSKTLNGRKRTKKTKHLESEEKTGPSKAKRLKNNNNRKKTQMAPRKSNKSTKLQKQLEEETQEVDTNGPQENYLNVLDLSKEADSFSRAPIPQSPTMREPQYPSPQKHKPILYESSKKSAATGSGIQYKYLKISRHTEEREPHPHYRQDHQVTIERKKPKKTDAATTSNDWLPHESYTSPAYDSAKLTFQSGPVLKTRPVRYDNPMNTIVRNLLNSTAAPLNNDDMSPLTIVLDPDTNCEVFADCVHHTRGINPSKVLKSINNTIFSSGKILLKPMDADMRNAPKCDILIFYIVRGSVVLRLHKSVYNLESGDFFYIPPCNTYHMQNFGSEEVELIFTQIKSKSN